MQPRTAGAGCPGRSPRRARHGARRAALLIALALALPSPWTPARAADPTPRQEVEGRLMCYCGCADLTVRVCTCGTADAIRAEIDGRLASGETPDQVVAAFVARHGEQIRSAPTKSGFNLLAWVTPFVVILMAGSALVVVVRRWGAVRTAAQGAGPRAPAAEAPLTPEDDSALERVRREMREGR